jgi:hypothetical protein
LEAAKAKLAEKIRSDEKAQYDSLIKKAVVQVLAAKTTKRRKYGSDEEVWTAPIVLTIQEQGERWKMEELLRKSKVFLTFHWPKEFLEPMKELKKVLKEGGVNEGTHYVRMRPDNRDGKWRIRADVKPKEGEGRFVFKASWPVPPVDEEVHKQCKDWAAPTWAQVAAKTAKGPSPAAGSGGVAMET